MNHLSSETLNLYLDGQLDLRARALAEAHLAACPHCAEELRDLRVLFAQLAELPDEPLDADLAAPVLARIGAAPPDPLRLPPRRRAWVGMVVATQVALVALLGVRLGPLLDLGAPRRWLAGAAPSFPDLAGALASLSERALSAPGAAQGLGEVALGWPAEAGRLPGAALAWLAEALLSLRAPALLEPPQLALLLIGAALIWLLSNRLLLVQAEESGERASG